MKKIDFKKLVISFSIVIILVLLSMIFTKNTMDFYGEIVKPDLAPKPIVFPIVWTILYTIFAVTIYRFIDNKKILTSLIVNLVINVIWPILFFRFGLLLFSAFWLILIHNIKNATPSPKSSTMKLAQLKSISINLKSNL